MSEQPFRQPRRPEEFLEYYEQRPPWDIGRPQPALAALEFRGRVLDAGCGTGEHALLAASRGLAATGVDTAPVALEQAREKAAARGLTVRFELANALELATLGEKYGTVLDSGLFHVFDDADRASYVAALAEVLEPGGRYLGLFFSDQQPGEFGPRRITEAEVRAAFAAGWRIDSLERTVMAVTRFDAQAWLAQVTRT